MLQRDDCWRRRWSRWVDAGDLVYGSCWLVGFTGGEGTVLYDQCLRVSVVQRAVFGHSIADFVAEYVKPAVELDSVVYGTDMVYSNPTNGQIQWETWICHTGYKHIIISA